MLRPATRFSIALVFGIALLTWAASLFVYRTTRDWFEKDVALVFQNDALYPHMTVRGNLELPLRMRGVGRAERGRRRPYWTCRSVAR